MSENVYSHKYVVFEKDGVERLEHFPMYGFQHKEYAEANKELGKPIAAGVITVVHGRAICGGYSDTLGLESREYVDAELFKEQNKKVA